MALKTKLPVSTHFKILDGAQLVGTLRIVPKGILWNAAGKDGWMEIDMPAFVAFVDSNGTAAEDEKE